MKDTFAILLSGMLALGAASSVLACSGSKKAAHSAAPQSIQSAQALPAATTTPPTVAQAASDCPACPEAVKAAMNETGCDPDKAAAAAALPSSDKASNTKLTAEKVDHKANCEMKAGARCGSKVEGTSVPPPALQPGKKAS